MTTEANPEKSESGRRVLVAGASGIIGTALLRSWMDDPIHLIRLVRHQDGQSITGVSGEAMVWPPSAAQPISDMSRLVGVEAVICLSGANIAGHRWTKKYKQEIATSRVVSTRALAGVSTRLEPPPRVLVCASAIGIYGDRGDEVLTESSTPGSGFLAETCVAWEAAARAAKDAGIRVVQ